MVSDLPEGMSPPDDHPANGYHGQSTSTAANQDYSFQDWDEDQDMNNASHEGYAWPSEQLVKSELLTQAEDEQFIDTGASNERFIGTETGDEQFVGISAPDERFVGTETGDERLGAAQSGAERVWEEKLAAYKELQETKQNSAFAEPELEGEKGLSI